MDRHVVSARLSRREFAGGAMGLAMLSFLSTPLREAAAQSSDDFATLGLPELAITVTDTGFEGVPQTTVAGRYLLKGTSTITKTGDEVGGDIAFLSPSPAGLTVDDLMQIVGGAAPSAAGATPEAGGDTGGENFELPLAVYQMYFAGGVATRPGATSEAVIDLKAGEYIVWGDDPTVPQSPARFTVTGDFPRQVAEPAADVTVTLVDFDILFEGSLTAGEHTIKVQHHGAQPHFLDIFKGPDDLTKDQVMASLMGEESSTPVAGTVPESALQETFESPTQSIGTVTYQHINLDPGTYMAACFFPTAGTGVPHAMNGMVEVFKVTA